MSILGGLLKGYGGSKGIKRARRAANQYAEQARFNPYNINTGGYNIGFQGNQVNANLSPQAKGLQDTLYGGAGSFLGSLGDMQQSGGITPMMGGEFGLYNQNMPSNQIGIGMGTAGANFGGVDPNMLNQLTSGYGNMVQGMMGQAMNPQQFQTNMGDQFNQQAQGFLGGLGSFNQQQLAGDYTNMLRQQAMPGEQRQVEQQLQSLFSSGRLGSSGGAGILGQLSQANQQADLSRQLAGQQFSGQEQNRMAGLASQFGQLGNNINMGAAGMNMDLANAAMSRFGQSAQLAQQGVGQQMQFGQQQFDQNNLLNQLAYNRAIGQDESEYQRAASRTQERFANAMGMFGMGQQNLLNQFNIGGGLLGGAQGMDQNLLQAIGMGGQLGAARSGANAVAYEPKLNADSTSRTASFLSGLGGAFDAPGMGSFMQMFKGGGGGG